MISDRTKNLFIASNLLLFYYIYGKAKHNTQIVQVAFNPMRPV